MDIGVVAVGDFAAIDALLAAIDGGVVFAADGLLAVERFREVLGDGFEFGEIVAGKEIGMGEPAALEGALQQADALFLFWKIFKCHGEGI